eukprot:15484097-Alexandrium_andersonii.AAC.1
MQHARGDGRAPLLGARSPEGDPGPGGPRCPFGRGRRAAGVLPAARACSSSLDAGSQRVASGWSSHP